MIRRPPRSTLFSLHDALPICRGRPAARAPRAGRARPLDEGGAAPLALGRNGVEPRRLPPEERLRAQALGRSEEHTSELQSRQYLVCRLLLEKKTKYITSTYHD